MKEIYQYAISLKWLVAYGFVDQRTNPKSKELISFHLNFSWYFKFGVIFSFCPLNYLSYRQCLRSCRLFLHTGPPLAEVWALVSKGGPSKKLILPQSTQPQLELWLTIYCLEPKERNWVKNKIISRSYRILTRLPF